MSVTTRCVASEDCMSKTGENLESEEPEELGELTMEGGEGKWEADVGLSSDSELRRGFLQAARELTLAGEVSLQRLFSCWTRLSCSNLEILSLSSVFSRRRDSFSSFKRLAMFCSATFRSISPCSYC